MPHLQLDVPAHYPVPVKRELARRLGDLYGEIMETTPDMVDVTLRELGEGGVWRCGDNPTPAAVLSCDIRRGRSPEQRAKLAEAFVDACVEILGLVPTAMTVEFSQHPGDEIYRKVLINGVVRGGLARDWTAEETTTPLMESLSRA
jgi:phenylpyruvate tautomerase PptA (4-oxalocrotonate tautomerase family)